MIAQQKSSFQCNEIFNGHFVNVCMFLRRLKKINLWLSYSKIYFYFGVIVACTCFKRCIGTTTSQWLSLVLINLVENLVKCCWRMSIQTMCDIHIIYFYFPSCTVCWKYFLETKKKKKKITMKYSSKLGSCFCWYLTYIRNTNKISTFYLYCA